jgi:hypothetical protein
LDIYKYLIFSIGHCNTKGKWAKDLNCPYVEILRNLQEVEQNGKMQILW